MPTPARPRRLPIPLERDVQRAILAYLRARGVLCWRNNTAKVAIPAEGGKARRFLRAGLVGSADILGCFGGRLLALEVKRPGERPTPVQVAFLRSVQEAGGIAFWADGLDVAARVLDAIEAGCRVEVDDRGGQVLTDEEVIR